MAMAGRADIIKSVIEQLGAAALPSATRVYPAGVRLDDKASPFITVAVQKVEIRPYQIPDNRRRCHFTLEIWAHQALTDAQGLASDFWALDSFASVVKDFLCQNKLPIFIYDPVKTALTTAYYDQITIETSTKKSSPVNLNNQQRLIRCSVTFFQNT